MTDQTDSPHDHFGTLAKHWKLCFIAPLVLAVAAYIALAFAPKTYRGHAVVTATAIDYGAGSMNLRKVPTSSLKWFFQDSELIGAVIEEFRLDEYGITKARFLTSSLQIRSPRNTDTIELAVFMPTAELARDVAKALAEKGAANYEKHMTGQLVFGLSLQIWTQYNILSVNQIFSEILMGDIACFCLQINFLL